MIHAMTLVIHRNKLELTFTKISEDYISSSLSMSEWSSHSPLNQTRAADTKHKRTQAPKWVILVLKLKSHPKLLSKPKTS